MKCAALTGLTFHPNAPAHEFRQTPADVQPQAGAAVFAGGRAIGLRESLEDTLLFVLGYADASVSNAEMKAGCMGLFEFLLNGNHDLAMLGELNRVTDKIDENLTNSAWITHHCVRNLGPNVADKFETFLMRAKTESLHGFAH